MRDYSLSDIIGPIMIGPSSSHTAGAVRIANVVYSISGESTCHVRFELGGSFAKTYSGHGTDKALLGGVMGYGLDDERLKNSFHIAKSKCLEYSFSEVKFRNSHPNSVRITWNTLDGKNHSLFGSSIGGGNILITEINGFNVELTGDYSTLLVRHVDRSGIVAQISSSLTVFDINIAFMKVFRREKGNEAFTIIESDSDIPEEVLRYILRLKDITSGFIVNKRCIL